MADEQEKKSGTNIVPIHAATGKVQKRGPGRPKKIHPKPTREDLEYHARMAEEREKFIGVDQVVKGCEDRKDALERLRSVQMEMAREAASLQFTKQEQEKYGKDTAQISTRRINALRAIADIELEIKKLGAAVIDLRSEKIQKVFQLWIGFITEAAQDLPPEQADLFMNRLENLMDGWEDKASEIIR